MAGVGEVANVIGDDPVSFAISGGEDYVLALTIPQERFEQADTALIEATGFELLAIGAVEPAGDGDGVVILENEDGTRSDAPSGHDHFG